MRKKKAESVNKYKIIVLDDDQGIIDSLAVILKRNGYELYGYTDPAEALEAIKKERFNILVLDYLLGKTRGDEIVRKIREFNKELYILLLTGHNDIAPAIETLRDLEIQGYCEKSNKFDQLILLIESGIKVSSQIQTISSLNDKLDKAYSELEKRYLETIEALRISIDAKDIYTRGHSDRVSHYAVSIGKVLCLDDKDLETLRVSGIFHDLGKIGAENDILFKPDILTQKEFDEIKQHTIKGANILSALSIFRDVVPVVKYHHERIDGMGYPEGLSGEQIPFLARILAVADAFDAMITDKVYRDRINVEEAKKQLVKGAGTQFDTIVVEVFLQYIENNKLLTEENR